MLIGALAEDTEIQKRRNATEKTAMLVSIMTRNVVEKTATSVYTKTPQRSLSNNAREKDATATEAIALRPSEIVGTIWIDGARYGLIAENKVLKGETNVNKTISIMKVLESCHFD